MTFDALVTAASDPLDAKTFRALLAELDAIDAAIDAIEARYGAHELIADARMDANDFRARLILRRPDTVH